MHARRLLLNLALLLAVAGLGAFVFFPRPPTAPPGVAVAPAVDTAAVRHIRIQRRDRPPLTFARTGGVWRLTAPIEARANPLLMRALLELPRQRSRRRYATSGLRLARYGLAPPQASVYFGDERIDLGKDNPLDQRRYVRYDGGLYLIADRLGGLPQSPAANWVSLALLPPDARIVDLQLPTLRVRAQRPAGWTLQPAPAHYSADQVAALLRAWQHATALRLTAATGPPATVRGEIRITFADGTRRRLQIVATQPELVLRAPAPGLDYHLPAAAAGRLLQLPAPSPDAPASPAAPH